VTYEQLLDVFWANHDPCRPSYSTQYRSAIFYRTAEERAAAEASCARIARSCGDVHTAIEPLGRFYRAEDYHQKYRLRNDRTLMSEFQAMFPVDRDFVDSTAAARANGWLDGCGEGALARDTAGLLGLSDGAVDHLLERAFGSRHRA
jgi:hypothetical protein